MNSVSYFHNCSKEYINSINSTLYEGLLTIVGRLPKREKQEQINEDLLWLLAASGWSFDKMGTHSNEPPKDLGIEDVSRKALKEANQRSFCRTSTTMDASWYCDFARSFGSQLVQLEAQFGKVEAMFKDFCGFSIAFYERRIALGIEIVLCEPTAYFAHRRNSIGGMAYFDIARKTLPAVGLACPIWLIGLQEGSAR